MENFCNEEGLKKIYLAGGCFWGVEEYFSHLEGIISTIVGYANGNTENPSYEQVCCGDTGFAEAVEIIYNPQILNTQELLEHYFSIINPISINHQGNDRGIQYRTGIYYTDNCDKDIINSFIKEKQKNYNEKIAVEYMPIKNFYKAEDYHQQYLKKNPQGYCHIDLSEIKKYKKPNNELLRQKLTDLQYNVTQNGMTETPFSSEYEKNFEDGIYVDITTGEPLFSSKDKFDAGCGWPSFTKPIKEASIKYRNDNSFNMNRIEVRSNLGNSHLGHVFDNEPTKTKKRYCINGASLKFIPKNKLKEEGYFEYLSLFE